MLSKIKLLVIELFVIGLFVITSRVKYIAFVLTFMVGCYAAIAQSTISMSAAIQTALTNNLQLQIYRNDAQIAHNNNYPGNAGMRPNVSLNASDNPSLTNINQQFANGTTIERNNVFNNSVSANVLGTITLYDGSKMFATKRKLEALDMAGFNLLRSQVQTTIGNVISAYSNLIRQTEYLKVVQRSNELSTQRLDIVKVRMAAGLANNTDLYLAELETENSKQSLLSQQALIQNAYTDLNLLMNIKTDSNYLVEAFTLRSSPFIKSELDSLLKQNPDLLMARNQVEIAEQTRREIAAARMPLVRLSGAYNYNLAQSQAGFSLLNQSYGPQAGLSLSVPLFTGGVNARNYENAKLNLQSSEWRQQQTQQTLQGTYLQAWQNYTTVMAQLESDAIAVEKAKSYIDLMQERFKAGQNTIIELKEAQRSYEDTYYRYISNQYIAKLTETQLLGLTGQLTR